MLKAPLEQRIENMLENAGYVTVKYHGCFDVAAKKKQMLLIKVLQNIDAFSEEQSENLRLIASNLGASPLLVGEQTRVEKLRTGIVYERYGIPSLNYQTLQKLVEDAVFPTIYRDRGGLYVKIDSDALREARGESHLTQRELAELVGVNNKVIYEHEKQQLRMMLEIAQKLEKVLHKKIIKEVDILNIVQKNEKTMPKDSMEKGVGKKLKSIGFSIDYVRGAPFDILAKDKALVISDVESNKRRILTRVHALKQFIEFSKKPAVVITERHSKDALEGIPVISKSELEEIDNSKQLISIAKRVKR